MSETTETLPNSSEFAQEMVNAGAKPTVVTDQDIQAMLAQMNALQEQVNLLNAERGVPLDRVDGYRKQLEAHFKGRKAAAHIGTDFVAPEGAIAALPQNPDDITSQQTESLHFALSQWVKQHPGKELDYLETLAGELHQVVLDREGKHGVMHQRVSDLEAQVAALLAAKPNVTVANG